MYAYLPLLPTSFVSVFTVRCYAEDRSLWHVICLYVLLRYRGHIGWNTSKIISWLISRDVPDSNFPNPAGAGFAKNQHQR